MAIHDSPGQKPLAPDEIDLVAAFVSVVNFFRKNGLLLLIFIGLGLGLGVAYFKLKSNVYSSKIVAECMSLPDSRVVELLQVLETLRENEDWVQLGTLLGLQPDEAKMLKKFLPQSNVTIDKASKGVDDYLLNTHDTQYSFSLIVWSKDNDIWPKLQNGLIQYLSDNQYSKVRVSRFIENKTRMIEFTESEIRKCDSLNQLFAKKVINSNLNQSTLTSPGDYSAILVVLQEKKQTFLDELRFAQPVRPIMNFVRYSNPVEPNLIQVLLISVLVGLALGILVILARRLAGVYRNNSSN